MADHRRSKCAKRFVADFNGSRNMQFKMFHKACEIFHERGANAREFWNGKFGKDRTSNLKLERIRPEHFPKASGPYLFLRKSA
jgi:hypothetical protein